MKKEIKTNILIILISLAIGIIGAYGTTTNDFSFFDKDFLITQYGVFLGFGLTIYTFLVSTLSSIVEKINKLVKDNDARQVITSKLTSALSHLKEDNYGLFIILVLSVIIAVTSFLIKSTSCFQIYQLIIDTISITIFVYAFYLIWDIIKSLFGMTTILLELINQEQKGGNEEK